MITWKIDGLKKKGMTYTIASYNQSFKPWSPFSSRRWHTPTSTPGRRWQKQKTPILFTVPCSLCLAKHSVLLWSLLFGAAPSFVIQLADFS